MRDLMNEHNRRQSVHVLDQVRYMTLYGAKLDGFRDKLAAHRTSISVIGDLIEDQSPAERRNSIMKLDALVEEHERRREVEQVFDQIQEEESQSLEQDSPDVEVARHLSNGDIMEQLEDNQKTKGVPPQQADEQLFPITPISPISRTLTPQPYLLGTIPVSLMPMPAFKLDVFSSRAYQNQKIEGLPSEGIDAYDFGEIDAENEGVGPQVATTHVLLPPQGP